MNVIRMLEKVVNEIKTVLKNAANGDHESAYQMRDSL